MIKKRKRKGAHTGTESSPASQLATLPHNQVLVSLSFWNNFDFASPSSFRHQTHHDAFVRQQEVRLRPLLRRPQLRPLPHQLDDRQRPLGEETLGMLLLQGREAHQSKGGQGEHLQETLQQAERGARRERVHLLRDRQGTGEANAICP